MLIDPQQGVERKREPRRLQHGARSVPGRPALTRWTRDSRSRVMTWPNEASLSIKSASPGAVASTDTAVSVGDETDRSTRHHLRGARQHPRQRQCRKRDARALTGAQHGDLACHFHPRRAAPGRAAGSRRPQPAPIQDARSGHRHGAVNSADRFGRRDRLQGRGAATVRNRGR